jgi:DNA polymerase-4
MTPGPLQSSVIAPRAILHVDMDAFFASAEVLDDPTLAGKPVIVGGQPQERGVVAACSYEARKFGIHSAMSSARAQRLCPQAIFLHPRFHRYAEISRQIFTLFEAVTPQVEPLSIDEAFLDVTGCQRLFGPAATIGRALKQRIKSEVGLNASVGVAPNKFLAKLGSDLEKPDGFVVIEQEEAAARLAPLPVGRLWGVGKVTQATLERAGIRIVSDLLQRDLAELETILGSYAGRVLELAQGIDDRRVETGGEAKSVGAENTFVRDIGDPAALRAELDALVERVGRRLRAEGMRARTVVLKARYPDFTTVTRSTTLPEPTDLTPAIRSAARELLETRLARGGKPLRLLGVSVSNLEGEEGTQGELFPDASEQRQERIDKLMDRLQEKYGSDSIHRGARKGGRERE